jgi:signal transduction histidine kinase
VKTGMLRERAPDSVGAQKGWFAICMRRLSARCAITNTITPTPSDAPGRTGQPERSARVSALVGSGAHARRKVPKTNIPRALQHARAADAVVLQERARIARELHDSVGQTLYAVGLTASRALPLLDQNDKNNVRQMLEDVLQLARTGQSELRMLVANIRSDPFTSGGLLEGLSHLATDVRARHGLDVRLSLAGQSAVPLATRDALVLISREALHNVVRHAGADRVDVGVEVDAGGIALRITDNGRGFDPSAPRPGHFGLQSMRERAAAIGGRLDLHSAHGMGTHILVSIPVTREV